MSTSIKITIPEPCHENWSQMTPTQKGRHCASCQKEVIDFTSKTDKELAKLLQINSNICGRVRADQLNREIRLSRKQNRSIPSYAAALLIPLAIGLTQEVTAQNATISLEQTIATPTRPQLQGRIAPHYFLQIKGAVADQQGGILSRATIQVKGTHRITKADSEGNYTIGVSSGEILVFSHIGFNPIEIKVNAQKVIRVNLEPNEIMGDIIFGEIQRVSKS